MDIRLDNGYDVHRFGPGDHVILCGVKSLMIGHFRGTRTRMSGCTPLRTQSTAR